MRAEIVEGADMPVMWPGLFVGYPELAAEELVRLSAVLPVLVDRLVLGQVFAPVTGPLGRPHTVVGNHGMARTEEMVDILGHIQVEPCHTVQDTGRIDVDQSVEVGPYLRNKHQILPDSVVLAVVRRQGGIVGHCMPRCFVDPYPAFVLVIVAGAAQCWLKWHSSLCDWLPGAMWV